VEDFEVTEQNSHGFTLVEIIIVFAVIALLAVLAFPEFLTLISSENKVKAVAKQLMDDLKFAQNEAAGQGSGSVANGRLVRRKVFVVFDTVNNAYRVFRYQDTNGDNVRTVPEVNYDIDGDGKADPPVGWAAAKTMANGVSFSRTYVNDNGNTAAVNKGACANGALPASLVTFGDQNEPPCNGLPCLLINSMGFPIEGTSFGGTMYLSNGKDAFAVTINPAGLIRMCKWDKGTTKWVDAR
jgi:prepilin-type N-terminal cleavage/methylation domain-containing protein